MPDVEKVIKGLECCILGNKHEPDCDVCPYSAGCNDTCDTMDEIHADALALLKAQEPVDAIPVEWLRDKMRGYASSLKSTETAALVMVMQMWQKEQEVKR